MRPDNPMLRTVSADLIRIIGQGEMMTEEDCAVVCDQVVALRVAEQVPEQVLAQVEQKQREAVANRLLTLIGHLNGLVANLSPAEMADKSGLIRAIRILENERGNL